MGSIPGWGRSPGGGHGNPLQYSCLENPTDREAQQATAHRVTKSQTRLKELARMHTNSGIRKGTGCYRNTKEKSRKSGNSNSWGDLEGISRREPGGRAQANDSKMWHSIEHSRSLTQVGFLKCYVCMCVLCFSILPDQQNHLGLVKY